MEHGRVAVDDELTHYRQMVDSITEYAVIRLDDQGRVRSWHPGAERMTGFTEDEIIGQPASVFYTPEDRAGDRVELELRTAAEKGRYETDGWRVRKDGTRFWASMSLTPTRDAGGRVSGFVKVTRDLSDQVEQNRLLRKLEKMIDAITDYLVIEVDRDGVIQSWNRGAQRLTRYSAEDAVGRPVSMLATDEDVRSGMVEREMAVAARDGRYENEGWRVRKDGSRFWANVVVSPIWDEEKQLIGFVKVARDLTDRREQEQLVQRQRDEILDLSTPVIKVWDQVLVLPIIGTLDSLRATRLTEALLTRISEDQAEVVILDVSGVPAIDTDVAQHMLKTVEAARLMGAVSVLSGVRPETAQAIVHLGIDLGTLRSRNNLRDALQLALRLVGVLGKDGANGAKERVGSDA